MKEGCQETYNKAHHTCNFPEDDHTLISISSVTTAAESSATYNEDCKDFDEIMTLISNEITMALKKEDLELDRIHREFVYITENYMNDIENN